MRWLILALPLAVGCGASGVEIARASLTTSAHALVQADHAFGDAYQAASEAARDSSATQEEKDQKMVAWEAAADEFESVYHDAATALVTAEVALDGYATAGDAGSWDEALACAAASMRRMAKVLEERGLRIPAALAKVLALSEGLYCAGAP